MFSGMTNGRVQDILKREFGAIAYTPPSVWYVGVSTTLIQPDGSGVTEPTDGMYERVAVSNDGANWENADNLRARQNVNALQFPRATENWPTVVSVGLFESATGGTPKYFADLEYTKLVQFNDSLVIEPGELQIDIIPVEV